MKNIVQIKNILSAFGFGLLSVNLLLGSQWAEAQVPVAMPPATAVPAPPASAPAPVAPTLTGVGAAPVVAAKPKDESNVLNFEAEIIDGERKRPDLFLQIGTQKQTMEAVVYSRKDFNDFHKAEAAKRPAYIDTRASVKPLRGTSAK